MTNLTDLLLGSLNGDKKREDYVRAPFPWIGGKWRSLEHLIKYLPVRKVWVDGCGGSGVVTLNRPTSELDVFNDRNTGVVAFFRVLRDDTLRSELIQRLSTTVYAKEEFFWCRDTWQHCDDNVERAARWYYMIRCSFAGVGRTFGRSTAGLASKVQAYSKALPMLPIIATRFKNVQVDNLDICDCLCDYDSTGTVSYVDPDYIDTSVGTYKNTVDHIRLIKTIKERRGFIALSGYANSLYDSQSFWDARFEWEVSVSSRPAAFNDRNGLEDKENVMDRSTKGKEVLWIKESK